MAGFENYGNATKYIEREIIIKGIALGIDWADKEQVQQLAHDALNHLDSDVTKSATEVTINRKLRAQVDLYGLAGMMLKTMTESAELGFESHGGLAWKSLSRALLAEEKLRNLTAPPNII